MNPAFNIVTSTHIVGKHPSRMDFLPDLGVDKKDIIFKFYTRYKNYYSSLADDTHSFVRGEPIFQIQAFVDDVTHIGVAFHSNDGTSSSRKSPLLVYTKIRKASILELPDDYMRKYVNVAASIFEDNVSNDKQLKNVIENLDSEIKSLFQPGDNNCRSRSETVDEIIESTQWCEFGEKGKILFSKELNQINTDQKLDRETIGQFIPLYSIDTGGKNLSEKSVLTLIKVNYNRRLPVCVIQQGKDLFYVIAGKYILDKLDSSDDTLPIMECIFGGSHDILRQADVRSINSGNDWRTNAVDAALNSSSGNSLDSFLTLLHVKGEKVNVEKICSGYRNKKHSDSERKMTFTGAANTDLNNIKISFMQLLLKPQFYAAILAVFGLVLIVISNNGTDDDSGSGNSESKNKSALYDATNKIPGEIATMVTQNPVAVEIDTTPADPITDLLAGEPMDSISNRSEKNNYTEPVKFDQTDNERSITEENIREYDYEVYSYSADGFAKLESSVNIVNNFHERIVSGNFYFYDLITKKRAENIDKSTQGLWLLIDESDDLFVISKLYTNTYASTNITREIIADGDTEVLFIHPVSEDENSYYNVNVTTIDHLKYIKDDNENMLELAQRQLFYQGSKVSFKRPDSGFNYIEITLIDKTTGDKLGNHLEIIHGN